MRRKFRITLLGMLVFVTSANAQGDRSTTPPSQQGGSYGSPGMSGATGNTVNSRNASSITASTGTPTISAGNGGQVNVPSGEGGNRPSTEGGDRPQPDRPSGDTSGQGELSSTDRPSLSLDRSSTEGGLFSQSGGLASRFNQTRGEGTSWANFGGFGASASSDQAPTGSSVPITQAEWTPENANIPAAPSTMQNTDQVITTAQAARDETSQAAQDAAAQAQTTAQQTYDQFWTDYYSAVDYAADAYYQTVTASVDYAQQAYFEALGYTTATVDYYVDYAAEYAQYCFYYPWDCYSYAYDEASATYVNIEYVSDQPAATIAVEPVTVTWGTLTSTPTSSAEAYEALVVFANDQLGMVVQPLYAGDATQEIQLILQTLPNVPEEYAALLSAANPAYWGVLQGGVAAVGQLSCSSGCSGENIPAELSGASGGVYMLNVADPMPTDSATALDLITKVYPALNGLAFAEVTNPESGLAYMATTYGIGSDANGQGTTVVKLVYAGVTQVNGQTVVYVLVAVGQTEVEAFFNMFQP